MDVAGHLTAALDRLDLPYDEEDGGRLFRLSFTDGDSGLSWTCVAYPVQDARQAVFFSVAPEDVPEPAREKVSEYLTRVNYGLVLGNFEMDWADGEVRCRTSVPVPDGAHVEELIETVVTANLALMGRYLPGLRDVLAGNAEPAAAVARAEGAG